MRAIPPTKKAITETTKLNIKDIKTRKVLATKEKMAIQIGKSSIAIIILATEGVFCGINLHTNFFCLFLILCSSKI